MLLAKETVRSALHACPQHFSSNKFVCIVYEHMLTLSFTQVSCERAFSKLKQIKTRLRSNLANDKLEAVMLMTSEKDLLDDIAVHDIIAISVMSNACLALLCGKVKMFYCSLSIFIYL